MKDYSTPIHKTNILPLRWIANYIFHPISYKFFMVGLNFNDHIAWDKNYKWYNRAVESISFKIYKFLDRPYQWWGTMYKLDMDAWRKELWGEDEV